MRLEIVLKLLVKRISVIENCTERVVMKFRKCYGANVVLTGMTIQSILNAERVAIVKM